MEKESTAFSFHPIHHLLIWNLLSCQALNIQGRLKFLHGQSRQQTDSGRSTPPQLALFAIATPLQPPAILEIRTRNMIFRTKHKLDFTPMACDAKYVLSKLHSYDEFYFKMLFLCFCTSVYGFVCNSSGFSGAKLFWATLRPSWGFEVRVTSSFTLLTCCTALKIMSEVSHNR